MNEDRPDGVSGSIPFGSAVFGHLEVRYQLALGNRCIPVDEKPKYHPTGTGRDGLENGMGGATVDSIGIH
ncbi:hypothetical protein GCM10028856_26530 [Halopiger thermotolerans]